MSSPPSASDFLTYGFIAFTLLLGAGVVWNVYLAGRGVQESRRRTLVYTAGAAVALGTWLTLTWSLASAGAFANFDQTPPGLMLLFPVVLIASITVAYTRYGTRFVEGLPLWVLVLGQSFRLPLEVLMHRAAEEGVMPWQMSYSGGNFDIFTGLTALPVAWLLASGYRHGRTLAVVWNIAGVLLLANILTIAIASTPVFAAFGPDRLNTWVAYPPFVWLPTVMVVCAITGHLVIFRKLAATTTPLHAPRSSRHAVP